MSAQWAVLGLAHPRASWYREVARWASTATLPIDVTITMSAEEARARLRSGRAFSAMLCDRGHPDLDVDLIAEAAAQGCVTFVVDDGGPRDWRAAGALACLPSLLDAPTLGAALRELAPPLDEVRGIAPPAVPGAPGTAGRLVAVTGPGGAGASTVARAVAQGLGPAGHGEVLLADLALHADQAMAHHVGDVVPGVPELVDTHRRGVLDRRAVHSLCWSADHLPYRLLLGLRRHRDWTALRARSTGAALDALLRSFDTVVADIDDDFEDETTTGSMDVADRTRLAREAVRRARLVLVACRNDLRCLHRLAPTVSELRRLGVPGDAIAVVAVGAPRRPARRAELVAAVDALTRPAVGGAALLPTVLVPWRNDVAIAVHDGAALPRALADPLAASVAVLLERAPRRGGDVEPERVAPGSIGHWSGDEDEEVPA